MELVVIDGYELGVEYADIPPWRSYELSTFGRTAEEAIENAGISEVDQDGGEIRCYPLWEAPDRVYSAAENMIRSRFS